MRAGARLGSPAPAPLSAGQTGPDLGHRGAEDRVWLVPGAARRVLQAVVLGVYWAADGGLLLYLVPRIAVGTVTFRVALGVMFERASNGSRTPGRSIDAWNSS
jgi:hypothetical protein